MIAYGKYMSSWLIDIRLGSSDHYQFLCPVALTDRS